MARASSGVDLSAIRHNCSLLKSRAGGQALLCAVVKADAYGHGAAEVARAAQEAGADWLAVAAAGEAISLRSEGVEGRILVLGALEAGDSSALVELDCDVTVWDLDFLEVLSGIGTSQRPVKVHVKLDTGMGRLGTRDSDLALEIVRRSAASDSLELAGVTTHFATADSDDESFLREQLARFQEFVAAAREIAPDVMAHAANSAATLRIPEAALDMVRCGVAVYGLDPFGRDPSDHGLLPAMELRTTICAVKPAAAGDSVGYGRKFICEAPTVIATAPIGYADGVLRALGEGRLRVISGSRLVPIVGAVSMDNITVDLGFGASEKVGDELVLIGRSGGLTVHAEDWARAARTINYEIVTGIRGRVERHWTQ